MLMIEHIKMMQMPYLDIRSMLLSRQVPYRTNSSQLFWNRLFQKKANKQGRADFVLLFSVPLVKQNSRQNKVPSLEMF